MSYRHTANTTRFHVAQISGPQTIMLRAKFDAIGDVFGCILQTHNDMQIQIEDAGSSVYYMTNWNGTADVRGPRLRFGRWYHMALAVTGITGSDTYKIYLDGVLVMSGTSGSNAADIEIFNDGANEWCNGCWEGLKVFRFQMSREQIVREMSTLAPVQKGRIYACIRGRSASDHIRREGNSVAWTRGGTAITGPLSPRSGKVYERRAPSYIAGGGGVFSRYYYDMIGAG